MTHATVEPVRYSSSRQMLSALLGGLSAGRSSLNRLLDTGTLAPNHRRRIEAELSEVEHVLNRATP